MCLLRHLWLLTMQVRWGVVYGAWWPNSPWHCPLMSPGRPPNAFPSAHHSHLFSFSPHVSKPEVGNYAQIKFHHHCSKFYQRWHSKFVFQIGLFIPNVFSMKLFWYSIMFVSFDIQAASPTDSASYNLVGGTVSLFISPTHSIHILKMTFLWTFFLQGRTNV